MFVAKLYEMPPTLNLNWEWTVTFNACLIYEIVCMHLAMQLLQNPDLISRKCCVLIIDTLIFYDLHA